MMARLLSANRSMKRRDYKTTTRLWGLCLTCRWTWQWNGKTEHADDAVRMITESACRCNWGDGR